MPINVTKLALWFFVVSKALAWHETRDRITTCMSQADAQQVVDNYQNLQTQFSEALANVSLSPNFASYSDSLAEFINGGCTGPQPVSIHCRSLPHRT